MKIKKIKVQNFRLLKDFEIDLEERLSLVIGKNNTGKTSLLTVLDKFLNNGAFSFDDFNIDLKNNLKKALFESPPKNLYPLGITLTLFIKYDETDYLANVSQIMTNLDPDNNYIVLSFEYLMDLDKLRLLKTDFNQFIEKERDKRKLKKSKKEEYEIKDLFFYLRKHHTKYFDSSMKSLHYDLGKKQEDHSNFIDLRDLKNVVKSIINFKYISAKREVTNKDNNSTLSLQTSKIYDKTESKDENDIEVEKFKDQLIETDDSLTAIYEPLFEKVVKKVARFGGMKPNDSMIRIESSLQDRELLKGNTTVTYKHQSDTLPEYHNGLGYMNLISMIFEIEILIQDFKRKKDEKPADINLLFIEEPEAHTHPQMQYIFINNIKDFLGEGIVKGDDKRGLQTIISTHSSHIVSECEFNDIKYLKKGKSDSIISKNLIALEKEYSENGDEIGFKFLKQYLTLHRSELFFADKAILIEGDTERILLPAMMKKMDQDDPKNPLLSQNITIVEVGAHSQIYERFIEFIGLEKCLIITDIDSYYEETILKEDGTPQTYANGVEKKKKVKKPASDLLVDRTSNNSLIFFHKDNRKGLGLGNNSLSYYKNLSFDWKIMRKNKKGKWVSNRKGNLLLVYQTEEEEYHARSFEDAFFNINKTFMKDPDNLFPSITKIWLDNYRDSDHEEVDEFILSEDGIGSKPSLAIEILLNSASKIISIKEEGKQDSDKEILFSNWNIPLYIKEGLVWLKKD